MRLLDRFRREFVLRAASLFHSSFNINKQHFAVSSRSSVCSTHFSGIADGTDGRTDGSFPSHAKPWARMQVARLLPQKHATLPSQYKVNTSTFFQGHVCLLPPVAFPLAKWKRADGRGRRERMSAFLPSLIYPWENILSGKQSRWRTRIYLPCL